MLQVCVFHVVNILCLVITPDGVHDKRANVYVDWFLGRSHLSVSIVEVGQQQQQPSPLSDRSTQQLLDITPLETGEFEFHLLFVFFLYFPHCGLFH